MQRRWGNWLPWAFALASLPLFILIALNFRGVTALHDAGEWVSHTHQVDKQLNELVAHLADVETGQRGYVITGKERFLDPYDLASSLIARDIANLKNLAADNIQLKGKLEVLQIKVDEKLMNAKKVIDLRRTEGFEAARDFILTEQGKQIMDTVRLTVAEMRSAEQQLLQQREVNEKKSMRYNTNIQIAVGLATLVMLIAATLTIRRQLSGRTQAEAALQAAYDELDARVKQRTADLDLANLKLRQEADDRFRAQQLLQESDARFKSALAAARMGAWEWQFADEHVIPYGHLLSLFGISEPEYSGKRSDFLRVIEPSDRISTADVLARAARGQRDYDNEFRVRWPDNSYHWLMTKGTIVNDIGGKPTHMVGIAMEITELKIVQEDRERLLKSEQKLRVEAEAANQVKDEFLATVSHELRTPLNAILGWTTMLRKGQLDSEGVSKALAVVERNAKSQTKLIEDLLDISRVTSGRLQLDAQTLDLAGVIRAALESAYPAAEARQIKLQALLDSTAGPVWGDPQRMQQVVWNLLSNAIKFTPKSGNVQVQLERVNSHVEIAVSDTGQGIDPAFLPHVFERFQQADATTKRKHSGLGLGLAIVRHLVELHGGSVSAESKGQGMGATFRVVLPIMLAKRNVLEMEAAHILTSNATGESRQSWLKGVRVLAVDDEADARELLLTLLTSNGVEVRTTGSGAEALTLLENWRPDVLISDIGMPGMDGYELLRTMRRNEAKKQLPRVPAVALTAYAKADDRLRALLSGFQTHIAKPVDPDELTTVIASLAGRLTP